MEIQMLQPGNTNTEDIFAWQPLQSKVKLFLWSIAQEALPLGEALQRRGIQAEAL